jgi:hypothetical protein
MMTLRSKATAWAFATAIGVRFLFWLGGVLLGWRESNAWEVAFAIGAMVAFFIAIDEVDAVRSVYALELAKLRVEANRDAVAWAEGNGETQSLGLAYMEGWNKDLHAKTSATSTEAATQLEKRVREWVSPED